EGERVVLREDVGAGHKIALRELEPGELVMKYGFPIGKLTEPAARGAWLHSHNMKTALEGLLEYRYSPHVGGVAAPEAMPTFMGYPRRTGRVGTRNEVWIVNTVGCVNTAAERIARAASERFH